VDFFCQWTQQREDGRTKERYYPNIARRDMLAKGYVAKQSVHSRGSAIDLSLYRLDTVALVSMGGGFDLMDERSHHGAKGITKAAAQNRELLRSLMENSGFAAYRCEWWHYTLIDEPYPDAYFDFPITA
jgi:D-alanyl-D-alanine dipeptidase